MVRWGVYSEDAGEGEGLEEGTGRDVVGVWGGWVAMDGLWMRDTRRGP